MPSREKFEKYLYAIFICANGTFIDVNARELHKIVGNYLHGYDIILCCNVMLENMHSGDVVLVKPIRGNYGNELTIRYKLPRTEAQIIKL